MKSKSHFLAIVAANVGLMAFATGATVLVTPTSTDRLRSITGSKDSTDLNGFFSTWQSDGINTNTQRTLQTTSNATFIAALQAALGPLGVGQSYQINSATLKAGSSTDDYTNTSTVHLVLVDYTPGSVTWNNFNGGGVAGTQYVSTAAATSVAFDSNSDTTNDSASWTLTTVVQDWLSSATPNKGLYFRSTADATGPPTFTAVNTVSWTLDAQIIPEPHAALLGAIGMLALLRRRR